MPSHVQVSARSRSLSLTPLGTSTSSGLEVAATFISGSGRVHGSMEKLSSTAIRRKIVRNRHLQTRWSALMTVRCDLQEARTNPPDIYCTATGSI